MPSSSRNWLFPLAHVISAWFNHLALVLIEIDKAFFIFYEIQLISSIYSILHTPYSILHTPYSIHRSLSLMPWCLISDITHSMDLIDFRIHKLNRDHSWVMKLWKRQTDDRTRSNGCQTTWDQQPTADSRQPIRWLTQIDRNEWDSQKSFEHPIFQKTN
jgi:hypothetical protein